ncbi:MAG TPA: PLP-dependent aminotransferase family protein [Acidimicrobiia bacterium]
MTATPAARPPIGTVQLTALLDGDSWRNAGHGPLARRLAHVVRSRIRSGLLPEGTVLPPERALARALDLSRSTVVAALDELRAEGIVDSRHGSGTWVAATGHGEDAGVVADRLLRGGSNLNLAASVPADASHLPDLRVDVADFVSVTPAHGYAPAGLPALRDAIAQRWRALGVRTVPAQIHVTNGAQHAIDLALGALTRPGDVVALEDPTYVGVFDVLDARGLRPLPIPLDALDDDGLARLCRAGRARALFLVPGVHSPTGRVRRTSAVRRLAHELDELGLPVVADETLSDLAFDGRRPLSLAAACTRAPVVTVESTSKVAWGGLRVGWLRADRDVIERTVAERSRHDFGTAIPSQLLALRLLRDHDELVARRRDALRSAAATMTSLLRRELPGWRFVAPAGGLSMWVDTGMDAARFSERALEHGVTVAAGSSASRGHEAHTHLRLCFDRPALELEAAITRLARAAQT